MSHVYQLSSRGRWSVRLVVLLMIMYEFQSPRLFGDMRFASTAVTALAALFVLVRMPLIIRRARTLTTPPLLFLLLYYLVNCASFMWSYDPSNSLLHGVTLVLFLLLATSYSGCDSDEFAGELITVVVSLAVASWAMVLLAKNIAVLPDIVWRLNGPMMHPQRLSLILSLAIICLTLLKVRESDVIQGKLWLFYMLVLLTTIAATQTRAFTFFCAVTVGYILFWHVNLLLRLAMVSAFVIAAFLAFINWDIVLDAISRDGSNTMTLSGRTVAWENAIAMIKDQPLLGYGFASFNTSLTQHFFASGYIIPHAHNTWINATFETGLLGGGLMTLFMASVLINRRFFNPSYSEAMMIWVILSGLTGLIFGGKINPSVALVIMFIAQLSYQNRRDTVTRRFERASAQKTASTPHA